MSGRDRLAIVPSGTVTGAVGNELALLPVGDLTTCVVASHDSEHAHLTRDGDEWLGWMTRRRRESTLACESSDPTLTAVVPYAECRVLTGGGDPRLPGGKTVHRGDEARVVTCRLFDGPRVAVVLYLTREGHKVLRTLGRLDHKLAIISGEFRRDERLILNLHISIQLVVRASVPTDVTIITVSDDVTLFEEEAINLARATDNPGTLCEFTV